MSMAITSQRSVCGLSTSERPLLIIAYRVKSIESCLERPDFLDPYNIIIVTSPTPTSILQRISQVARDRETPVFLVQSLGFYSHFSVYLPPAFPVVETHPDPVSTVELRLLDPWPELLRLVEEKTKDIDKQTDYEHGHIPYMLLLLHYLDIWKQNHSGKPPQNYAEKSEFRRIVQEGARTSNAEGGEENFDEAVGAVLKALNPSSLSSGVKEVLEAEECTNLTAQVSSSVDRVLVVTFSLIIL